MTKTVLVVDDSRFMRTVLSNELTEQGYNVITARNGLRAVEKVRDERPDVVTMDVQMPKMDGLEATGRIMAEFPTPIIMLSAHTDEDADTTLDAINLGAVDFLMKPGGKEVSIENEELTERLVRLIETVTTKDVKEMVSQVDVDIEYEPLEPSNSVRAKEAGVTNARDANAVKQVTEKLKEDDEVEVTAKLEPEQVVHVPEPEPEQSVKFKKNRDIDSDTDVSITGDVDFIPTVIIGASTGGPGVVERIIHALPASLRARVIIVQHMPDNFTNRLSQRLNRVSDYNVFEAFDGATVSEGDAIIAKGGHHLEITKDDKNTLHVSLNQDPRLHGLRPAIDVTMETGAKNVTGPLVGVALTGMGSDGSKGIKAIKEAGGYTIAQDEKTSTVFGIPREAIKTGCVDRVLPDTEITNGIVDILCPKTGDKT